jgi:predicted esterase
MVDALVQREHDVLSAASRWTWTSSVSRTPPSPASLTAIGFSGSVWVANEAQPAPNLLVLLHGLGDSPTPFARFASALSLPSTSALALSGPLPLPAGLPGASWCDSFEADGSLIDGSLPGEQRRVLSLVSQSRRRLLRLLEHLEFGCGWPSSRVFFFGYGQGGVACLDLLCGLRLARLGGVVSWCGLPLPEAPNSVVGSAAAASTPLLVVAGASDRETPPAKARRRFQRLVDLWRRHQTANTGGGSSEGVDAEQNLVLLPDHGGSAMVGSASDARRLHEFFARHLALATALEDDPTVVRVG